MPRRGAKTSASAGRSGNVGAAVTLTNETALEVQLLGPVEVFVSHRPARVGGPRPRALVAILALEPGRLYSSDRLIDELWGADPPRRARESLQMHVSRVRRALADAGAPTTRLVTRGDSYGLVLEPGERDIDRWDEHVTAARRASGDGDPEAARERLASALALWRGEPLAGVVGNGLLAWPSARASSSRGAERAAWSGCASMSSYLGRHEEAIAELEALAVQHPFQESDHGATHARPLPLGPAGRCAGGVQRRLARASSTSSASSPVRSSTASRARILRQDSSLTPRRRELPPELEPDHPLLAGLSARARAAHDTLGRRATRPRRLHCGHRSAGDRADAARRRAGGRGACARGRRRARLRAGDRGGDRRVLGAEEPRLLVIDELEELALASAEETRRALADRPAHVVAVCGRPSRRG